ncbi:MAG: hypothetical protein ACRD21_11965 [Vicinamibacteria bacterium]
MPRDRIRGFRHGADDYVVKTVEPDEITAAEWDLLSRTDGSRTPGAIRDAIDVPGSALVKMVRSLKEKGFLRLAGPEPRERKGA